MFLFASPNKLETNWCRTWYATIVRMLGDIAIPFREQIELLVCYLVTLVIPRQHLPRLQNVRPPPLFPKNKTNTQTKRLIFQWLFLVPVKGGRWHIIPQLAVHTTYIPLIVLAFWGVKNATDPTFYGNQKQPLNFLCPWQYLEDHPT